MGAPGGIILDSGNQEGSPNGARVTNGKLHVTLGGIEPADPSEIVRVVQTEDVIVRSTVHEKIHQGNFFSGWAVDTAVAALGFFDVLVEVGTSAAHMLFSVTASQLLSVELYEGPTIDVEGLSMPIDARNRDDIRTPTTVAQTNPSLLTLGGLIDTWHIPGGSGGNAPGGMVNSFNEWLLAPDTNYLLSVANNLTAGAAVVRVGLEFYEDPAPAAP